MTSHSDLPTDADESINPYQPPLRVSDEVTHIGPHTWIAWVRRVASRVFGGKRILVAGLWLPAALVSNEHPGDEYGLFFLGAGLPAIWLPILFESSLFRNIPQAQFGVALLLGTGFVTMYALGALLDLVRARTWLLALLTVAFFGWLMSTLIGSYPTYARAISKNGSLHAYWSASLAASLLIVSIVLLILTSAWRLVVRMKRIGNSRIG